MSVRCQDTGLECSGNLRSFSLDAAADDIFISDSYDPLFAMDMGGTHRKVRNLALNLGANTWHPGDMN